MTQGRNGPPIMNTSGTAADRVLDLLSSFYHLRDNNRVLVRELRGSLERLRELRLELSNRHIVNHDLSGPGKVAPNDLTGRFGLTTREEEVAILLAQGKSNQSIARTLNISAHTARHHTQRILSKLRVHSRGEAGARIRG